MKNSAGACAVCVCVIVILLSTAIPDSHAASLDVVRRVDVGAALGHPPTDFRIRAIAHDGRHLWLLAPQGDALLEVNPRDGSLVARHALRIAGRLSPAGMAFGAGDLWLADRAGRRLLRLSRQGQLRESLDLAPLGGVPVGVDFFVARRDQRSGRVVVAMRAPKGESDFLQRFAVSGKSTKPLGKRPMVVPGSSGRSSVVIDEKRYVWVVAPRRFEQRLEGDAPPEGQPVPIEDIRIRPPDDSIPRGGEDLASTYRLALVDPRHRIVVLEVYPRGSPDVDTAVSGQTLVTTEGLGVLTTDPIVPLPIEYGPSVCRRVKFFYSKDLENTVDDVFVHFANPWTASACTGPSCPVHEKNATGGYLAQTVLSLTDEDPEGSVFYTVDHSVGSGTLLRHGRKFGFGNNVSGSVAAAYEIKVNVRHAEYNVLPDQVGSMSWVPEHIRDLYAYDGDDDSFGDDNPATDLDDYYTLDSPEVHNHLVASGALGETNPYFAVRAILRYVKRRHVYSGWDGGWSSPSHKLESPYASCSSSAFMVVALAREMGIPARLVGTTKQRGSVANGAVARDVYFHRWAQVFLPGYGWLRVDATPSGPGWVGFADVNGDGDFDNCDICTTDAQCQADFDGLSFADCGISQPFTNPNEVTGDGVIDGDDVEIIGAGYYTSAVLDAGLFKGVADDDLITFVAAGVRTDEADPLRLHYISNITFSGDGAGAVDRYADWRSCYNIGILSASARAVKWRLRGPVERDELVRIDLYRLSGKRGQRRYQHVARLGWNIPANAQSHPIDLSGISGDGPHVIVVSRQGGRSADRLSSFPAADWETFGESEAFELPKRAAVGRR